MTGTVIKTTGLISTVLANDNNIFSCRIKGSLRLKDFKYTNPITVGDTVDFIVENQQDKKAIITNIHVRKNFIARRAISSNKEANVLASNITQAILVITVSHPITSFGFIDRFIISSEANNIESVLVLNKVDLHNETNAAKSLEMEALYSNLGYKFIKVSSLTKINFDSLSAILTNKISLIAGHSGVGKSSIINALNPNFNLKTSEVSTYNNKGTHSTTFTQMYNLWNPQTFIIDSPGIKELGLVYINKVNIKDYFKEFIALRHQCRFNNCMHVNEIDCKVLEALEKGEIAKSRYTSYLSMLN
ncbi:MAG: ribosome small subunit-dependent GTPase A [Solitalea-like symbiont of Acarus siro]